MSAPAIASTAAAPSWRRRHAGRLAWNIGAEGLARGASLALTLVAARLLGVEEYGRFVLALAAALLTARIAAPAPAQDYPSRPVRIIVPFGAGGPAGVAARQIANDLQESLGPPLVGDIRTPARRINL